MEDELDKVIWHLNHEADQRDKEAKMETDFERKYYEAMAIMSEWKNIDSAAAVAENQQLRAEIKTLRNAAVDLDVKLAEVEKRAEDYKTAWLRRGEALKYPCLNCGYVAKTIHAASLDEAHVYDVTFHAIMFIRAVLKYNPDKKSAEWILTMFTGELRKYLEPPEFKP